MCIHSLGTEPTNLKSIHTHTHKCKKAVTENWSVILPSPVPSLKFGDKIPLSHKRIGKSTLLMLVKGFKDQNRYTIVNSSISDG